ncbi:MAG: HAD hydrolase-like protein [Gammaproteobacteria bacterium]|nr:HAD hydrolase-like protein [Gammaproteobacteria bacterium]
MSYSHFIFDLDGTLSDPLEGMADALNHALISHGYPAQDTMDFARYVGPPLEGTLASLTGRDDQEHIASLVAAYRDRYLESGFAQNSVYPGIKNLLEELSLSGQRLAVCTSKPPATARKILSLFQLDHYFDFISGGDIGVTKGDQLQHLLESDAIDGQALMIGDRDVDLIAAHRNNLVAAGVLWGYGSRLELSEHNPAHIVEQPAGIVELSDA